MVGRRDNVECSPLQVQAVHPTQGAGRAATVIALQSPGLKHSPFRWGVASGDPWSGGVVLWTRLDLSTEAYAHEVAEPGARVVHWELAVDPGFGRVVQRGRALAQVAAAYSVHVEVHGLVPGGVYWYRFHSGGQTSEVGCARSAPAPGGLCEGVRFAIVDGVDVRAELTFDAIARDDLDFAILLLPGARTVWDATLLRRLDQARDVASRPLRAAQRALPWVVVSAFGQTPDALRAAWTQLPLRRERLSLRAPLVWGSVARLDLGERTPPGPTALGRAMPRWSLDAARLQRGAVRGLDAAQLAYVRCDANLDDVRLDVLALPPRPELPCARLASYTLRSAAGVSAFA